jgi:bacterioferritin-associated ferredoxin
MRRRDALQECQARECERDERERALRSERVARVREHEGDRLVVDALQRLKQLQRIVPVESQCARLKAVYEEAQQDDGCRGTAQAELDVVPDRGSCRGEAPRLVRP